MNTSGGKTPTTYSPFLQKIMITRAGFINKNLFCVIPCTVLLYVMTSKHFCYSA